VAVGGVLVGGAGCPLLFLLLVGLGEASVLGAFSFHLFLLYFFFDRWHFGGILSMLSAC
jgi:hypothetical protein